MLAFATDSAMKMRAEQVLPTPRSALTKPSIAETNMADVRVCAIPTCGKPERGRHGLCQGHYLRKWRYGDPLAGAKSKGLARDAVRDAAAFKGDGCLFWQHARDVGGAGVINRRGKMVKVPREVCRLVHGDPPASFYHAAHSCGNGHLGCVNPAHLRWATPTENNMDKVLHGTHNRGTRNPSSKLTEQSVLEIRKFDPVSQTYASVAKKYGVTRETVRDIITRRTWAWL